MMYFDVRCFLVGRDGGDCSTWQRRLRRGKRQGERCGNCSCTIESVHSRKADEGGDLSDVLSVEGEIESTLVRFLSVEFIVALDGETVSATRQSISCARGGEAFCCVIRSTLFFTDLRNFLQT